MAAMALAKQHQPCGWQIAAWRKYQRKQRQNGAYGSVWHGEISSGVIIEKQRQRGAKKRVISLAAGVANNGGMALAADKVAAA
jgi:hypothetical protein